MAHLGVVAAGADLSSSVTATLTAGATGVSVGFNVGAGVTQHAVLTLLKASMAHANGHGDKVITSAIPGEADGAQAMVLTQKTLASDGASGNTTITTTVSQFTLAGFAGTGATAAGIFTAIGRKG